MWKNIEKAQIIKKRGSKLAKLDVKPVYYELLKEYAHSNYTIKLKGANAKVKANAVQGISEILCYIVIIFKVSAKIKKV